jgi:methionyl-tRNA formyltransferase
VPSLVALTASPDLEVAAVVTQPDKRRGRGGRSVPSAVKAAALERGIPVLTPVRLRDPAFVDELRSYAPDFLVVVAYGKVLPREVLRVPSVAPVNLHASLLPLYRGAAPIAWAIIDGRAESGLTTMLMSEGLDEGDVLLTEHHEIGPTDTTASLSARMADHGGALLLKTLARMTAGTLTPTPQQGAHTYARMFTKDDGALDWARPAVELARLVRGLYPWPAAFCSLRGVRLKVLRAEPIEGDGSPPGTVVSVGHDHFDVATGHGLLRVLEVQPEGKRPMSVEAFLSGHALESGAEVGS